MRPPSTRLAASASMPGPSRAATPLTRPTNRRVHRKGALSAAYGEPGVIPGFMGTASFHIIGGGDEESFCSSSHGAGREFCRRDAAKRINARRLKREMHGVWFDHRRAAMLRGEALAAYKDIHAVMRAQRELTKVERQLRPLLSYKGV
jgi:tRNA-splicing ligase RtcB (3'-phosphate/5'-hydroxy nucleic acid ligase)